MSFTGAVGNFIRATYPDDEQVRKKELEASTPLRVLRAWKEFTSGYQEDPADVLTKGFENSVYDEMVSCFHIPIRSTCEHHILPIIGEAHFAYVPDKKIVGLSKIPRFIDILCRRLQVQEALTTQIVDVFQDTVKPFGCAVTILAYHCCMISRGVKISSIVAKTTALRGSMKDNVEQRNEYLAAVPKELQL